MEKLKIYGKKNNKEEEFLGTIYVNGKKEIVVDIKDFQVKKEIIQEINKELQKHGGILLWPKLKEVDEEDEKNQQELGKKIKLLFEEDKKIKKWFEDLKNLWREYIKLSIKKEKLVNKKSELSKKEIEEIDKDMKEIKEKINKKTGEGEFLEKLWEIEWECYRSRDSSLLRAFSALRELSIEKPGSILFLPALRLQLVSSDKKYGGYVLSKLLITEED